LHDGDKKIKRKPPVARGAVKLRGTRPTKPGYAKVRMMGEHMPKGDKSAYTDKQQRKADHIAEGYKDRGLTSKEAERRAWATVNKESGGGNKSGSGRGKPDNHSASSRGGRASKSGSSQQRSAAARKGWETRRRNAKA
jgi:plasmid stabilization system protein ParE